MAVPDQQGPRNIHSDGGWDCTFPLSLLWASLLIFNIGSTGAKGRLVTNNLPLIFTFDFYLFTTWYFKVSIICHIICNFVMYFLFQLQTLCLVNRVSLL